MIFSSRILRSFVVALLTMCLLLLTGCSASVPISSIVKAATIPTVAVNQGNPDQSDELRQTSNENSSENSSGADSSNGTSTKSSNNVEGYDPSDSNTSDIANRVDNQNGDNPDINNKDSEKPEVEPDPPGTPIHPYYLLDGTPPTAPGLAMRKQLFAKEPDKIAYLTFDDGPYPQTTPKLLQILKEKNVHATFFVIGRQVERYPELVKAEFEQGNAIGNHTYSHNYSQCYLSPETFLADIKKNEDLIYKAIGIRPRIIRAPGGTEGHFHLDYFNAIDAHKYLIYDWNVSTGDTTAKLVPKAQLVANIKAQVPNRKRIIILMHDIGNKVTTVEALPEIIDYLKQQGYSFGILSPQVAPIIFPGGFQS